MNIRRKLWRIYGNPYDIHKPPTAKSFPDKLVGVIEKIGAFLAADKSLIKDEARLPAPKNTIIKTLDQANAAFVALRRGSRQSSAFQDECDIERIIQAIQMASFCIQTYSQIDNEDKKLVDYYNSFHDMDDIPEMNKIDFMKLQNKYRLRGMRGDGSV